MEEKKAGPISPAFSFLLCSEATFSNILSEALSKIPLAGSRQNRKAR
jgi:hypothetical protein